MEIERPDVYPHRNNKTSRWTAAVEIINKIILQFAW